MRDSNAGIAVTPEEPLNRLMQVIKLLKDEKLRELMGKNGRELVINNFNWKHTAKKTIVFSINLKGDPTSYFYLLNFSI